MKVEQNRSLVDLRILVPYNEFIGDLTCKETHLVEVIEEWMDMIGYEGIYKISSFGRIKSLSRITHRKQGSFIRHTKILALSIDRGNYSIVRLWLNGIKATKSVHRLVAIHFLKNHNNKPEVNHKIANKQNNRFYNLEWATKLENTTHAVKSNLIPSRPGILNPAAKLTESEVIKIRELSSIHSYSILGKMFNVDKSMIYQIIKRKKWQHI